MQPDLRTPFRLLGQAAVYTPSVGAPVVCQAMPVGGGETFTVGRVSFTAERMTWHVRRAEAGTPTDGTLTVDVLAHTIAAGEPVEGDARGLLWSVTADWGTEFLWTTPGSGGGSPYDPVGDTVTLTARAASAGATSVTLVASTWTSGRVRDGDTLTIEGTDYTVTGNVALSLDGQSYVFANVPITPGLSASLSGGETVTYVPAGGSNARPVRAAVADYEASEIMAGILTGDRRLVVRADDITPAPTTSDLVSIDGTDWVVMSVEGVYVRADPVAWVVQVRR